MPRSTPFAVPFFSMIILLFGFAGSAHASCYWQWQGLSSHFVCESDADASALDVFTTYKANIYNPTNSVLTFAITCDGGGNWGYYHLNANSRSWYQCDSSNSLNNVVMEISFDDSFAAGMQQKIYNIMPPANGSADYHFVVTRTDIDLNTGAGSSNGPSLSLPTGQQASSDCSSEHATINVTRPASFLLFKNAQNVALDLFWVNFTGQRLRYATLQPGATWRQDTYVGHVWVLAYTNGQCFRVLHGPAIPGSYGTPDDGEPDSI